MRKTILGSALCYLILLLALAALLLTSGSFWALLNPFALLCGVVSTAMITFHGAIYLAHRTQGEIQWRALRAAGFFGGLMLLAFTAAVVLRTALCRLHQRYQEKKHENSCR